MDLALAVAREVLPPLESPSQPGPSRPPVGDGAGLHITHLVDEGPLSVTHLGGSEHRPSAEEDAT